MLFKRIIPCLDVSGGRVVKGKSFVELRDAGDPVVQAKKYNDAGADELCFLDITASVESRGLLLDMIQRTTDQVFIPVTVGGGVKTVEDFRVLLQAGADKVAVNTAAIENPQLIQAASERFGSQATVVAIDAKRKAPNVQEWEVYTHGGRKSAGKEARAWAIEVERLGAGEIVLTSIDRDGSQAGYDLELTRLISESVGIPVVASGGVGSQEHLAQGFLVGKADAVLAASIFHYNTFTIGEVKNFLATKGIPVRQV